jgi:hypothetical protein
MGIGQPYASVDLKPMAESTVLRQNVASHNVYITVPSRLYPPVRDFGFGLSMRRALPGKDERGAKDESKYVGDGPLQGQDEKVVGLEEPQVPARSLICIFLSSVLNF